MKLFENTMFSFYTFYTVWNFNSFWILENLDILNIMNLWKFFQANHRSVFMNKSGILINLESKVCNGFI